MVRKKRLAARGSGLEARKIASPVWPGLYLYHLINNFAVKKKIEDPLPGLIIKLSINVLW